MKIHALGGNPWTGLLLLAGGFLVTSQALAGSDKRPEIPRCNRTIGTLAVHEPQSANP